MQNTHGYSKLDYRRIFKWGDFLQEVETEYPFNKRIDVEEKSMLKKLIDKGNELQEQLNENYLGGIDYSRYVKLIYKYIGLQDLIMQDIIDFRKEVILYHKMEEKKTKVGRPCK